MKAYTLFELTEQVRRVVALNFSEAIWVKAEIAQLNESRGHFYLNLIEKEADEETILAEVSAVIWQSDWRKLHRKLGRELAPILQEGVAVLVQVWVEFHERYGFKLVIKDIDPAYTIGQLALERQQILQQLEQEDLLHQNKEKALPLVLQRIAVLSAPSAAGYIDFQKQLLQNPYGYQFTHKLFPIAVQGKQVSPEFLQQLKKIVKQKAQYDAVVIVRGGGAKLDLAAFDRYDIAKAIAQCPLPVLTGIGHEVDETVADQVAHTPLKTPTAVAEFLITRILHFEGQLQNLSLELERQSQQISQFHIQQIQHKEKELELFSLSLLQNQHQLLDYIQLEAARLGPLRLKQAHLQLENLAQICTLLSPEATLKRGYSLTLKGEQIIQSANSVATGDSIEITLQEGTLKAIIK